MKIVAKVKGEKVQLVGDLKAKGIAAKLVRNGVIVELPQVEGSRWNEQKYQIPVDVSDATLFIDCEESGGGMTNTGSGTVVCGLSGKALRPYYIPKGYSNGTHAYFSVPDAVVTVTGYRKDSNVTIEEHRIVVEGNTAEIQTKEIWSGELEFLPKTFFRYKAAAEAADEKGDCYHCREPHFIAE